MIQRLPCIVLPGLAAVLLFASPAAGQERFAVIVGNDVGHPFRDPLHFAVKDADRMQRTLLEVGHFAPENVVVLRDQGIDAVRKALGTTESRIADARGAGRSTLLFFYYSGHANEAGLELGRDELRYTELKDALTHSSARVRIAVVDACNSGELTDVRGRPIPAPFEVPLTSADSEEGIAFISSTAIGEPAQESSAFGGGGLHEPLRCGTPWRSGLQPRWPRDTV
jgi:hypothetical protein